MTNYCAWPARIWSTLGFALLAGCAQAAPHADQIAASGAQPLNDQLKICLRIVYEAPDYAPLRPRIPLDLNDATVLQMSDASLATDDEIRAILLTHPKIQSCRNVYLNQIDQTAPADAPIVADGYAQLEQSLIDLVRRDQTWGEHLHRVRAISVASQGRLAAADQRVAQGTPPASDPDLARRHAAAFRNYDQTQQTINNLKLPPAVR